jgi:hypothetical protein
MRRGCGGRIETKLFRCNYSNWFLCGGYLTDVDYSWPTTYSHCLLNQPKFSVNRVWRREGSVVASSHVVSWRPPPPPPPPTHMRTFGERKGGERWNLTLLHFKPIDSKPATGSTNRYLQGFMEVKAYMFAGSVSHVTSCVAVSGRS